MGLDFENYWLIDTTKSCKAKHQSLPKCRDCRRHLESLSTISRSPWMSQMQRSLMNFVTPLRRVSGINGGCFYLDMLGQTRDFLLFLAFHCFIYIYKVLYHFLSFYVIYWYLFCWFLYSVWGQQCQVADLHEVHVDHADQFDSFRLKLPAYFVPFDIYIWCFCCKWKTLRTARTTHRRLVNDFQENGTCPAQLGTHGLSSFFLSSFWTVASHWKLAIRFMRSHFETSLNFNQIYSDESDIISLSEVCLSFLPELSLLRVID